MAFIYDVEITTHSIIVDLADGLPVGEEEISITTARGFLRVSEDELRLSYTENQEGGRVSTELRLAERRGEVCTACPDSASPRYRVELSKRGGIESDMIFVEGESSKTLYRIPPYSFDMELTTDRITSTLTKEGGDLRLRYIMKVGGQDRRVRLNIKVKRL